MPTPHSRLPWLIGLLLLAPMAGHAYPPAPHHLFYGQLRDEWGNPITTQTAEIILETLSGIQVKTHVSPYIEPGVNYHLAIPMDSGLTADPYIPTALLPTVPFRIKVRIQGVDYLPIEMTGDYSSLGKPGGRTRLDLTLGEDSNGNGLPDAWERALMEILGLTDLSEINPHDDLDGNGLTILEEYLAGTYAFDPNDALNLKITPDGEGGALVRFMAIRGRYYTLLGSEDMKEWSPVSFRLPDPNAPVQVGYYAQDVHFVEVAPLPTEEADGPARRFFFFKLVVR